MGEGVTRVGVDRAHGGLAGPQVVGVRGEDARPVALRRLADHTLGAHLADDAREVAPQRMRHLEGAVRIAEEADVLDPDSAAAAARCSACRMPGMSLRGTVGSKPPASPSVMMQYATSMPWAVQVATVPGRAEVGVIGVSGND